MSEETPNLRLVDGFDMPEEYRAIYRPGEIVRDAEGRAKRLPRFFYEIPEQSVAWETKLTEHFALAEFLRVDLKEVEILRDYPRHVPCAVRVLARYLERFRELCGAPVFISVNGGYRSPEHGGNRGSSAHSWGVGVDVFRIGSTILDDQKSIETYRDIARGIGPELNVHPYGHGTQETDDHLHLDLGFLRLVPADADEDERDEDARSKPERRHETDRRAGRRVHDGT